MPVNTQKELTVTLHCKEIDPERSWNIASTAIISKK